MSEVVKIYGLDFALINKVDGLSVQNFNRYVATGSGGPTPPAPQWEEHWEFGADGFGGSGEWTDDFWNVYGGYWDETESPGEMKIHVDDPYATWNLGYRPTKCRVTGTPNGTGGDVQLLDVNWVNIGSYPSVGEYDTVIEFDLTWVDEYEEPLGDLVHLYSPGYATITKIEFLTEAAVLYTLTIGVATGSGSVLPVTGTKYYAVTGLTISGIADSGWAFSEWTGDTGNLEDPSDAVTTIAIPTNADTSVSANFVESWRNLSGNPYPQSTDFADITTLGSNVYISTYGEDYNDDGWKNNGSRLLQWNGSSLAEVAGSAGAVYTGNWQSMVSIYPYGSTIFGLFGWTSGGGALLYWNGSNAWVEDVGDPNTFDKPLSILTAYDVYLATAGSKELLYRRHSEGGSYVQLIAQNNDSSKSISSMAEFNGFLYAIGRDFDGSFYDGYLWYYNSEDGAWDIVVDGNGFNKTLYSLKVYGGNLYAAGTNGKLYRYNGSNAWTSVADALGSSNQVNTLCVYGGKLYGGVSGGDHKGALWVWNDSNAWEVAIVALYDTYDDNAYSIKKLVTNGTDLFALTEASSGIMDDRLLSWTA